MDEIYSFDARIKRYLRIIAGLKQGDLALSLLDHLASLGLSKASLAKYASHVITILRIVDFDLAKATRADVERVVAWIHSQPYKEWTKHVKKIVLKKLVKFAKYGSCDKDAPYPPEVSWIKERNNYKDERVTPDVLLTPEDFDALIKATDNRRDRAMLYVLFEGAFRPGELLNMNVGSVKFKEVKTEMGGGVEEKAEYCVVSAVGKTGLKVIPLVVSYRPLLEWLEDHPKRNDSNAPLWCSLATNYKGERLSYRHFRLIIKRLARRAGLQKDVWPYLFRHSTLTALAKVFTEARLEQFAGWVHGSKMSGRYVHFSARDLEDAVLGLHAMGQPKIGPEILKLIECPRCKNKNPPGKVRCGHCGLVLAQQQLTEIEAEQVKEEPIESIKQRIEKLERLVTDLMARLIL